MRASSMVLAVAAFAIAQQAAAYCLVTNDGCVGAGGLLVEQDGYYINPQTGERVMDVPPEARIQGPQPRLRYCEVLWPGVVCRTDRGAVLLEVSRWYFDLADGEPVMDVPARPRRLPITRYVSGPLNAAEGIATPIGRARSASDEEETPEQAYRRRLRGAWSRDTEAQVIREEQERLAREGRPMEVAPRREISTPPPPPERDERKEREESTIKNTMSGETLIPIGKGAYVSSRDGRYFAPSGRNMLFDTSNGRFVPIP